jgi:hypothetical protein
MVAAAGCATGSNVTPGVGSPALAPQSATTLQRLNSAGPDWITKDGITFHRPHYMGTVNAARPNVQPAAHLAYGGGTVLTKPKMYLIFWGYKANGDAQKLKPLLTSYAKSIGGSQYNNIYTQYTGPSGNILNPTAQFGGAWSDNTTPVPAHPSDAQVAAEALLGVAHFGYDPNGSYVVATPHNHSSGGFGSSFCAYHSAASTGSGIVSYTNLPYMPDAGQNCGAGIITAPSDETSADEGMTIVEGHEYGESVTDPNPPSGWYDNNNGEIGDICAWQNIQNDPYKKHIYTAQPMWSNFDNACVHADKKF